MFETYNKAIQRLIFIIINLLFDRREIHGAFNDCGVIRGVVISDGPGKELVLVSLLQIPQELLQEP